MSTCYSEKLFNEVVQHLQLEKYRYFSNKKQGMIHFGISMQGNLNNIQYHIIVKDKWFITFAVFPISGDVRNKKEMTELAFYLHYVNCNLTHGNIELDTYDGEIRIKYFVNCDGIIPSDEIIEDSVQYPAAIYNHYGKGILGIIFQHMLAEEAITYCERSDFPMDMEMRFYYQPVDSFQNEDYIPMDVQDFLNELFDQYDDLDESDPNENIK